ncbi:hypothetical protein ABVK25_010513 [Lepraria finkii]|uniref:Uncharacterized protein n=1 Tax=Lepraria finkii TaxID=1340010 RepID=A0ABR4AWZ8_9LECA
MAHCTAFGTSSSSAHSRPTSHPALSSLQPLTTSSHPSQLSYIPLHLTPKPPTLSPAGALIANNLHAQLFAPVNGVSEVQFLSSP